MDKGQDASLLSIHQVTKKMYLALVIFKIRCKTQYKNCVTQAIFCSLGKHYHLQRLAAADFLQSQSWSRLFKHGLDLGKELLRFRSLSQKVVSGP